MQAQITLALGGISLCLLPSCTSLRLIHDPQFGFVSSDQIPGLLKSVRCELKTFYAANAARRSANTYILRTGEAPATSFSYFPIDPDLFGGVFLDLKVVDTLAVGTGDTNLARKQLIDETHSRSWTFAPILGTQNTYGVTYSLLIDQSKGLATSGEADPFRCYHPNAIARGATYEELADDVVPNAANFARITVIGAKPLAGWLLDNGSVLWRNFVAESESVQTTEQIVPAQMNYTFTIQATGGLNVRYSLISPVWSPAQGGAGASAVQTSQLQIVVNGYDATVAIGAKTGNAKRKDITPRPRLTAAERSRMEKRIERDKAKQRKLVNDLRPKVEAAEKTAGFLPLTEDQIRQKEALEQAKEELRKLEVRSKSLRSRKPTGRSPPAFSRGRLIYPQALPVQP
jgi:hypothetical protein